MTGSDLPVDKVEPEGEQISRSCNSRCLGDLGELFEAVTTLSAGIQVKGDRLTVVTNGGGAGVLAADALEEQGGRLTTLSTETLAKLDSLLPRAWSRGNPIDVLGDASPERYRGAVEALLAEPETDAILVMNCPTAVADSIGAANAVVEALRAERSVPVLTAWLGETAALPARRLFAASKIPTYETPDDAVTAFMYLSAYGKNQELLLENFRSRIRALTRPSAKSRGSWWRRCLQSVGRY